MAVTDLEPPATNPASHPAPGHFVQFYERDSTLVENAARYLRKAIESGHAALMVASATHIEEILELWKSQGFDASNVRERGQLIVRPATEALAAISRDGAPQPELFEKYFSPIMSEACRRHGRLVAFGEMVGLLWGQGRYEEAVHLESFWNLLASRFNFELFLAYPLGEAGPRAAAERRADALQREVDARLRAEQELADFLENAVVGLHRVGPDGTILWANKAELEMLGYEADEYVGRNIAEFHSDGHTLDRIMDRLSCGESLRDVPARLRCKDGSVRHVLIPSTANMREGKLVNTRCFTRDVSDRWLAQEALRERGAVLHLAMQGARMGYWVGDLERDTLRGSHELATLLGLSAAFDWSLDEFLALVHPADRTAFRSALESAIEGRREFLVEFRVRADTTSWRWFEGRGEAVYNEHGMPTRFYGVCMDITARKRAEDQIAHMAAVVDSADDAIVSKTLDGIVKSWNGGATRIFGYEAEEMIGRPITVIIPPELHHEEAHILSRIRAGQPVDHFVTTRVAKDGTRKKVSITVSPVRNGAGEIVGASKIGRVVSEA
jgi:PAS domain S-box-containing protein